MKRFIRSPAVQAALAWLIAAYVGLISRTLRWRVENVEAGRAALARPQGAVCLFWHGRILQACAALPFLGERRRRVMISLSPDGAFIARAAERIGAPAIRGSTGRPGEALGKGGAAAFRSAIKAIAQGEVMLVTPDGPRGPVHVMPEGPVQLARAARCQAFALGLAAAPAIRLGSWDGAGLPLPFARAALVVAGPFAAPVVTEVEPLRAAWQEAMRAAHARAEALLRDPAGGPFRRAAPLLPADPRPSTSPDAAPRTAGVPPARDAPAAERVGR